jgi:AcrR family transcriptional regulator
MPRLSRAESQARTRQKLLATAKTCFLRDGYAATSLEGIAEAAGFSKGAVYSNFESKDALCLAVIDSIREARALALTEAVAGKETLEERIAALESWAERNIGDRAWTSLEVEFAVHASRDKKLARELAKRERAIRDVVIGLTSAQAELHGLALPAPAEDVAVMLLSLGIGLGVQRAIDPSLPVRTLGTLARMLASRRERG